MSAYVICFAAVALLVIVNGWFYKKRVIARRVNAIKSANTFRYARNLNSELIRLFSVYGTRLQHSDCLFNGSDYDDAVATLFILRTNVYTTDTFKQLIGKQPIKRRHIDALQASIYMQIEIQEMIKADLYQALSSLKQKKRVAA